MSPRDLTFFLFFLISGSAILPGQDPSFSQFYANRLYLNPAMAGIGDDRRLFLNYRNQYEKAFVTYSSSYDQYIEPLHGGAGLMVMNDNQGSGSITQLSISAIYSYHIRISRLLRVNGGLQASWVERKLNASRFIFGDQIDPVTGEAIPGSGSEVYGDFKRDFPDFSTGIAAFYRNLYGGISLFHLAKPVQSMNTGPDARLARKLILYAGGCFPVYERKLGREVLQLNPNLIYLQQKNLNQLNYGLEVLYMDRFAAGFLVRQNLGIRYSSLIFTGGVAVENIRFRYSYDAQLSLPTVNFTSKGAHEISMIITIDGQKKIDHSTIKCPKF